MIEIGNANIYDTHDCGLVSEGAAFLNRSLRMQKRGKPPATPGIGLHPISFYRLSAALFYACLQEEKGKGQMTHQRKTAFAAVTPETVTNLAAAGFPPSQIVALTGMNLHTVRVILRQAGYLPPTNYAAGKESDLARSSSR